MRWFGYPTLQSQADCAESPTVHEDSKLLIFGTAYWDWRNHSQHVAAFCIGGHELEDSWEDTSDFTIDELDSWLLGIAEVEVRIADDGQGRQILTYFDDPASITSPHDTGALSHATMDLLEAQTGFPFNEYAICNNGSSWIYWANSDAKAFQVLKYASASLSEDDLSPGWRFAIDAIPPTDPETVILLMQPS